MNEFARMEWKSEAFACGCQVNVWINETSLLVAEKSREWEEIREPFVRVAPLQNEIAPKSFEFRNEKWNEKFKKAPKRAR